MDKRKLIGTIIGVIMFAALIVGATYAWLSFTATVTNSTANGTTLTYWVDYEKGTNISDIPILKNGTTSTASKVTVTAKRPTGSIADNIKLYLTTTSTGLTSTSGVVKYIVCVDGTDDYNSTADYLCDANFTGRAIQSVTATSTVEIYSGTLPGTTTATNNATVTYNIYFWIDAATLTNSHLTSANKNYSAYIHADSHQDRSNTYK